MTAAKRIFDNYRPLDSGARSRRLSAVVLGALAFAFFLRVLGQALVAFADVDFLPSMTEWYSGLLPYPLLLPVQIVILVVQAKISASLWRGTGLVAQHWPKLGRWLHWTSYMYAAGMVVRYVVTMSLYPEQRWLHGTIPIFFHIVLAAYLFTLGSVLMRQADGDDWKREDRG